MNPLFFYSQAGLMSETASGKELKEKEAAREAGT